MSTAGAAGEALGFSGGAAGLRRGDGGVWQRALLGPRDWRSRASSAADCTRLREAVLERQKNDAADAEAIVEAVLRPTMRFVAVKSAEQQASAMVSRRGTSWSGSGPIWSMRCARIWPSSA